MKQPINLPHGAMSILQAKAKVSYNTVLRTIKGDSENYKVLKALDEYLEERKQRKELLQEAL